MNIQEGKRQGELGAGVTGAEETRITSSPRKMVLPFILNSRNSEGARRSGKLMSLSLVILTFQYLL